MCKYSHISFGVKKVFFSISAPFILFLKLIALNYKRIITAKIIEVNVKNKIAQKLYLKYGFEILGIRKKYYDGIEDAYIMTLRFT